MTHILDEILAERVRQHRLWGDQAHLPMGTGPHWAFKRDTAQSVCEHATQCGDLTFRHILLEEVYELLAATTDEEVRVEAVQVAAVCVQIIEAIDTKQAGAA